MVWDEGDDPRLQPLHVGALFVGPHVRPTVDPHRLTHYSLLRTLEDGFGIARMTFRLTLAEVVT